MTESDAQLIHAVRSGRPDAFEALVRRYLRSAYAVALARTGVPEDAEEVCQDAFLVALERLADCREPDRFAGWLFEIVRNRALNLVRARTVRATAPLDEAATAGGHDTPLHDAARAGLRGHLLAALDRLTATQREVVLLHDVDGWRHREIATRLGLAAGTVRFHLHQARKALRAQLAGRYAEEVEGWATNS
ncbi:MAG: RNA polymerase sigma factor [Gemmatimonadota bacterium]